MLRPFESILGSIDMGWMNISSNTILTGMKFQGKDIYKKTIEIQDIATWVKTDEEFFVDAKGMLFNGVFSPVDIVSIGDVITIGQTITETDTGYLDLFFTKTGSNQNPMSGFVLSSLFVASALIIGYYMKEPELSIAFIELFK